MNINDFSIESYLNNAVVIVPIIIGIVQAIKMTGIISDKYSALVSLVVGILIAFITDTAALWGHNVLAGIVYGLSSSGAFSATKSILKK